MHQRSQKLLTLSALFLVLCGNVPNSPYDENSPNFVLPVIKIDTSASSLKPNDTIHFDSATLVLNGNMFQSRFQVKIDTLPWSSWNPSGAFPFSLLSDGRHVVSINSIYEGGTKIVSDSIVFFVKVQGFKPAFSPMGDTTIIADTGKAVGFFVSAAGAAPITYQWYKNTVMLTGMTNSKCSLSVFTLKDTGAYQCIASNSYGIDTSRIFHVKFLLPTGGIKGVLVSSKNAVKISGAKVTLSPGNVTSTSDSAGGFQFSNLRSGTYSITITMTGYQDYTKTSILINGSTIKDLSVIVLTVSDSGTGNLKVVYDGNGSIGGSVPVDQKTYKSGMTVLVLGNTGNLMKTGSIFSGWNTKADGNGTGYLPGDTFAIGTSTIILYAKWKLQPTLTITYNGNGNTGGAAPLDTNKYAAGDSVIVLGNSENLVKTGSSFAGWNTEPDGSGTNYNAGLKFPISSSSVTLYARWTTNPIYLVVYNRNGADSGIVPPEGTYEAGALVTVSGNIGNLVKIGYAFSCWNTLANETGISFAPGATFTQDSANDTLYATWTTATYTVKFDSQGGSPVDSQLVNYGDKASKPADPTRTGHAFGGWYKESGCVNAWDFANATVTANMTLYAKWSAVAYLVKFNSQGGSPVDSAKVNYGSKVIKPFDPTRTGYAFGGWYKESECTNAWDFDNATVAADMTLYAKWTSMPTVKFDSQGGSPVDSQLVNYGDKASKPADPTRTGHAFGGWYKESGCVNAWDFANATVTANMTLYAKWTAVAYLVKFNSQGGSPVDSAKVNYGSKVIKPVDPTRTGYAFGGWYKESECTNAWYFANATVTGDMTLYAKWTIVAYLVKFNSQGGSTVDSVKVNHGSKVNKPVDPTRIGYTFGGWYRESACTNAWDFDNATVTANITLYAKWTIVAYLVKFNSQGGTAVDSQIVNHGSKVNKPADPARTGYAFGGWYKESGCTNAWDFDNATVTADRTLYAKWTATYTLTVAASPSAGGSVTKSKDTAVYVSGTSVTLTANKNSGYRFKDWSGDATGTNNPVSIVMTKNMTVTANFMRQYTLTLSSSGNGTVNPSGNTTVDSGATTDISATPSTGYIFKQWSTSNTGVVLGNSASASTTVKLTKGNATVQGVFGCVTFTKQLQVPGNANFKDIVQTEDGGYLIISEDVITGDEMLIKLNSNGDIAWTKALLYFDATSSIQKAHTGYVIAGRSLFNSSSDVVLRCVAQNGNEIWSWSHSDNVSQYSGVVARPTNDNGFIIGANKDQDFCLIKIDASRNVSWEKIFDFAGGPDGSSDCQKTGDGGYIFVGCANMGANTGVVKTDGQGNLKWKTYFGSYFQQSSLSAAKSVQLTGDGDCLIAGGGGTIYGNGGYLLKFSPTDTNQVAFFKFYSNATTIVSAYPANNGYLFAGSTKLLGKGENDIYVVKINASGDIVKQTTYGTLNDESCQSMKLTSDGGCIAVGTNNWVVKTDENGEVD